MAASVISALALARTSSGKPSVRRRNWSSAFVLSPRPAYACARAHRSGPPEPTEGEITSTARAKLARAASDRPDHSWQLPNSTRNPLVSAFTDDPGFTELLFGSIKA